MRALSLSLILAFTVLVSGVSMAGSSDNSAPNAGLFAFSGTSYSAPQAVVVASR